MRWVARAVAVLVAGAVGIAALPLLAAGIARQLEVTSPARMAPIPDVTLDPLAQRSFIYASDGTPLAALFEEDRAPAALAEVPPVLIQAILATEDAAFYDHQGFSVRGTLRALRENAAAGGVAEGGSTITQQVIKQSVLDDDQTVNRKVREAMLAVRLENQIGKDGVLQRYLNTVYFGEGAYGVRAAAERFFGKDLRELTVAEAALLAGLIASPERFDPFDNPDAAKERRGAVLGRMVAEGMLTAADAEREAATPLPTTPHNVLPQPSSYFVAEVKKQLLADPRLGATPQERYATLFRGGVKVHTTLHPAIQEVARVSVDKTVPPSPFTEALVALDPASGAVQALVGGAGFDDQAFNVATQGGRQPGSSFKTIALAAWIEAGHSPEDLVDATAPCTFTLPNGEVWTVDNYDGEGAGMVTLREATIKSSNCAYARLALTLGPEKIVDMARRLGVKRELRPLHSIVLGAQEVTPLEMATVAGTLAADGVRRDPFYVTKVEGPDGGVLLEHRPEPVVAVSPQVARTVNDVLRGVIDAGTGRRAAIGRPAAGKTGTAQEWTDAWFVGWTPHLATAVWMGSPAGKVPMKGVGGINVTGGSFPAQTWALFSGTVLSGRPHDDFGQPDRAAWPPPGFVGAPTPEVAAFLAGLAAPPPPPAVAKPPPGAGPAPAPASGAAPAPAPEQQDPKRPAKKR